MLANVIDSYDVGCACRNFGCWEVIHSVVVLPQLSPSLGSVVDKMLAAARVLATNGTSLAPLPARRFPD